MNFHDISSIYVETGKHIFQHIFMMKYLDKKSQKAKKFSEELMESVRCTSLTSFERTASIVKFSI